MKTTALLLGFFCLLSATSCKCDFDEDEPRNKYDNAENKKKGKSSKSAENDSIQLK
ncbi:hypothetical protein [Chryseobacterium daeguense]|uniref:hypothetical protein n=1 Tax=Chryseobacterium daeguense TaxID=412438 RepID=UPI0012DD45DF|nr:hypothetical protein [Chryseobacterium daeguense]